MRFFSRLLTGTLLSILALLTSTPVSAQTADGVFSSLDSLYTVSETTTYVTHQLVFENQNPTVFIKQFGFQIPHINLDQIKVRSDDEPVLPNIVETENQTSIGITFSDKLVGQGKKRQITITYQDPEIASFTSNSGQVFIPQPNQIDSFDRYSLSVNTPEKSGLPAISSQTPSQTKLESDGAVVRFDQLQTGTLSLYYGQSQPFNFNLQYNLENQTNSSGIQQILLPPDTAFQTIIFTQIEPQPEKIEADEDGNWIATYQVSDQSELTVSISGEALLSRTPNPTYQAPLTRAKHLRSDQFWEAGDPQIQALTKNMTSIQDVWNALVPLGGYLITEQSRSDPTDALTHSQASAENIVDLLITSARNIDIPSRRIIGIADQDENHPLGMENEGLHVWAEYFDPGTKHWQPLDPFWQFSLGDSSFINQPNLATMVLAYNGLSSTSPYPNHLSSEITFSPQTEFNSQPISFKHSLESRNPFQLPISGAYNLEITNQTGQANYELPVTVTDSSGQIVFQSIVSQIIPYQSTIVPLNVYTNNWFTTDKVTLQLALDDQLQTITITRGPKIFKIILSPIGLAVGISFVVITLTTGSLLVLRRK